VAVVNSHHSFRKHVFATLSWRGHVGEVGAVDRAPHGHADALVAPWILGGTLDGGRHLDLPRDVLDGELTADAVVAALDVLDPRRGEPDLRIALGVEELRRPQVRVAPGAAGVDARDLGPAGDQRVRGVLLGGIESPPELAKWPRTVAIIMCLTSKAALECAGSTSQVPAGMRSIAWSVMSWVIGLSFRSVTG
jgi:hypothetical protein